MQSSDSQVTVQNSKFQVTMQNSQSQVTVQISLSQITVAEQSIPGYSADQFISDNSCRVVNPRLQLQSSKLQVTVHREH